MRDTETRRRSKQTSDTTSAGVDVRPDQVGQLAEHSKTIDQNWLDTLGDWLGSIGEAIEGLDLGEISFD